MNGRTNMFPVMQSKLTSQMLSDEPIRIDGMKMVFDDKVAVYPAKLKVKEKDDGESDSSN